MSGRTTKPVAFKRTTLAAAIALTFGAPVAFAGAPSANQLPGNGVVTKPDGTSSSVQSVSHGASPGTETIQLKNNANTVITWGGNTGSPTLNTKNQPGGFNIGPYAHLSFQGNGSAVLNIDASGKPSHIMGTLTAGNPHNVDTFVANGNGIIVGSGAKIKVQGIVGLVGESGGALKTGGFGYRNGPGKYDGIVFNGTSGGSVSVAKGASITGSTVLVAGGSDVNVNLNSLRPYRGVATVMAGESLNNGTPGATPSNKNAVLTVSGTAPSHGYFEKVYPYAYKHTKTNLKTAGNLITKGTTNFATNINQLSLSVGNKLINNGTLLIQNPSYSDLTLPFKTVNNGNVKMTLYFGHSANFQNSFTNNGHLKINATSSVSSLTITGGNFTNKPGSKLTLPNGTIDATNQPVAIQVTNGSITNQGVMKNIASLTTGSDSTLASFTPGANYSINNSGQITGIKSVGIDANYEFANFNRTGYSNGVRTGNDNNSTGSFKNTGTLSVASGKGLAIYTQNNLNLGGHVKVNGTKTATKPLSFVHLVSNNGNVTDATPLTFKGPHHTNNGIITGHAYLKGQQVSVNADLSGVASHANSIPAGYVSIAAGPKQTSGYAISVGSGATVSAAHVGAYGQTPTDHPNVLLNGTLSGNDILLGAAGNSYARSNSASTTNYGPVSNVFSGPNGGLNGVSQTVAYGNGIASTNNPTVIMNFTGKVKTLNSNSNPQAKNFRFRDLPITSDGTLNLNLFPVAYRTNGTTNVQNGSKSAVNILVNNNVNLHSIPKPSSVPAAGGSSTHGVTSTPNTHLVLQSTGNIDLKNPSTSASGGSFYWPGYLYLGTIQTQGGSPAPGTLSQFNEVRAQTNVNNVLPGYTGSGSGMHLMTQHLSLQNGANVVTNYNNVGSSTQSNYKVYLPSKTGLATHYGNINANQKIFYGGTLGSGTTVNYSSPVKASNFHKEALNSTR